MKCMLCPRACGVDRAIATGFCGAGALPRVARADLHFWEEPCISGTRGSGAVFFSGCNMACVFCQNFTLQSGALGERMTPEALAERYLSLQSRGAHNINLVTPAPHVPAIVSSLRLAKERGLALPIVYNTNAYETVETLRSLEGLIDVYLPDFKYVSPAFSGAFSAAPDYCEVALPAILEMQRQVGVLTLDADGLAERGVLIRLLVLPGCASDARAVLDRISEAFPLATQLSIMRQYAPTENCIKPPLNRKITDREYRLVWEHALSLGFTNVYLQERSAADLKYTPSFTSSL